MIPLLKYVVWPLRLGIIISNLYAFFDALFPHMADKLALNEITGFTVKDGLMYLLMMWGLEKVYKKRLFCSWFYCLAWNITVIPLVCWLHKVVDPSAIYAQTLPFIIESIWLLFVVTATVIYFKYDFRKPQKV